MNPVLEDAIVRGDVDAVGDLVGRGEAVDGRNRYGQTGLMLAVLAGRRNMVETLIAHGADLNVTAKFGLSALMLAVVHKHEEIARLLARAGADRSLRGTGAPGFVNRTASDLALAQGLVDLAAELKPES